jgi:hypothetical protein
VSHPPLQVPQQSTKPIDEQQWEGNMPALPWCDQAPWLPTGAQYIVAIGVISHESRVHFRNAVRGTWFRSMPPSAFATFVLRGNMLEDEAAIHAESVAHNDLLFVNGSSQLRRSVGPLVSTVLWFGCAATRAPHLPFVAK